MALSVIPKLYVGCKFLMPIDFTIPDTDGSVDDYDDVGSPPQVFFADSNAHDATASHADLVCDMVYSGSAGRWFASIDATKLTYARLYGEYGNSSDQTTPGTTPVLIMIVPNSSRDFANGKWFEKREALAA